MKFDKFVLEQYLSIYKKCDDTFIEYGTSGFRASSCKLDSIAFRMGIFATLRSKFKFGQSIGLMITASHNPSQYNGLKIIDSNGFMLDLSWESFATKLANIPDDQVNDYVNDFIKTFNLSDSINGHVILGRDTRESSLRLAKAACDGIKCLNGDFVDHGLLTTPQLHLIVLSKNFGGMEPNEEGYYSKISSAFNSLIANFETESQNYQTTLFLDCANGVGGPKMKLLMKLISKSLKINFYNCGDGVVNLNCGSDHVKMNNKVPINCSFEPGSKLASFDGDADRIIYYYQPNHSAKLRLLDGDKMACLFALFIIELVRDLNLEAKMNISFIQTAYSNGNATKYIKEVLKIPIFCVATGVKNLILQAQLCDIGIFFEANGHGSILMSQNAIDQFKVASDQKLKSAKMLLQILNLMNQSTGDAISDLLLVEAILLYKNWKIQNWDEIYESIPSKHLKISVEDRNFIKTNKNETICLEPKGLQDDIDLACKKTGPGSRAFVRPSGTEDIIRVYAEAFTQKLADDLAQQVGQLVEKYSVKKGV